MTSFEVSPGTILDAPLDASGQRLDVFLTRILHPISRARVQLLLAQSGVLVDGKPGKPSQKMHGGEKISILADPEPTPLRAIPEEIALEIVYEDDDVAVVNKPAGMMVHAGSGPTEDVRNRGTLVNALLYHMRELSRSGGPLRPGIVHRLDKQTSGLLMVAKNDAAHAQLSTMFASRLVHKSYLALVQGWLPDDAGTINAPISRDLVRRTRMTTRRVTGRSALSHWTALRRVEGPYGRFTLLSVRIETGRTHQIRVHLSSIGHPVVGDTLYGAAAALTPINPISRPVSRRPSEEPLALPRLALPRNFLHAAKLEFAHPLTGKRIALACELPDELKSFLAQIAGEVPPRGD